MTPYNFVDLADAPTAVFWVTNCCPVPADLHFIHVLRNIKRCLYESSYNGRVKFMVYDSTSPSLINENPPVENLVITRFPEGVVCYNTLLCVRESLTAFPTTGGRPFITRDFSFVSSVWSWFELSHGRPPFFNRFSDKPSVPLGLLKEEEKVTKAKEGARGSC
ncbi:uncharacterized protein LOC106399402 isoform X4 [Brassica napus]|uniref:uncharacterized protein LOC106399402 isoform X4 n=1 Tax=Brassica napus TaxID=3708 RepID=UPI00207A075B|nr:uncharacterized protein LOC106399402 isoform X4 [Brassica napus]